MTEHTCCIAASYEAKTYGVKTGTGVAEARSLCPHIVLVEARPKLYVDYHHRIVAAVNGCIPVTNVMSVDEMACRLMGRERALPNATQLVFDMKQALRGAALSSQSRAEPLPSEALKAARKRCTYATSLFFQPD
jgi:DNA polymerase-4